MNVKEIFSLSFDALRERKTRSALTIMMVIVGSSLMVALNGMTAGFPTLSTTSSASWRPTYCS